VALSFLHKDKNDMSSQSRTVSRRRVFYIPGYDPIPPRRYRELYRKEAAQQAAISGYDIMLRPGKKGPNFNWQVDARINNTDVRAELDVLVWSDIVRESMQASIPGTYWQLFRTAWTYITTGTLRRLMRLRKGPVIAALYPVCMLLVQAGLAFGLAALAGSALSALLGYLMSFLLSDALVTTLTSGVWWLAFVGGTWAILRWFQRQDGRFYAYYLMHDYAFSARWRGANPPGLEARMDHFRAMIAAALRDDVDEVLVVGHSSGAHLGVSILADLLREGVPKHGPALSFLTLGQVVPMVSFLPDAHRLRADLQYLSTKDAITWVDVTAPGDGCAFALCDPVAVSGVAPEGKRWPLVFSAAFTQSLSPERWKALRWRFFRLHFQYLCAFDRPKDYDYFQITAGPLTLGERYAGRPPSKSRIDVAASKYTSVAA
jgi:hypothetical protein